MPKHKNKGRKNMIEETAPQNIARFGSSLFLKGELSGEEDFLIEGKFQGKINLENHNILVGQGGKVEADIHVKNITINGSVKGNIYASGKVFISKDGQMKGDIIAPKISIMDGAQFKGGIRMNQDSEYTSHPEERTDTLPSKEETAPPPLENQEEGEKVVLPEEEAKNSEKEEEPEDKTPLKFN